MKLDSKKIALISLISVLVVILIAVAVVISKKLNDLSLEKLRNNSALQDDANKDKSQEAKSFELAKSENFTMSGKYFDGAWEYTLIGTTPTPCYSVKTDSIIAESSPEQVTMNVEITSPDPKMLCVDMINNFSETGDLIVKQDAKFSIRVTHKEFVAPVNKVVKEKIRISPFDGSEIYEMTFNYNPSIMSLEKDKESRNLILKLKNADLTIWTWIDGADAAASHIPLKEVVLVGKVAGGDIYRYRDSDIKSGGYANVDYMVREKDSNCTGVNPYTSGEKLVPPCFFDNSIYPKLITRVTIGFDIEISSKDFSNALKEFDALVASITINKVK